MEVVGVSAVDRWFGAVEAREEAADNVHTDGGGIDPWAIIGERTTEGNAAGYIGTQVPSFPAEATTTLPASWRNPTASAR
jgi:hypothetical protein